ncbi:unnamed protein product [Ambrosiozyma monospora]|uniref:Unnamed protein product n=1 Tax=Ambrosiozyma monospora TaxID=43982 RepID=A0ACB5TB10_AMBMO|nr:unnamed protein product [Ambrosiozyma monospora]
MRLSSTALFAILASTTLASPDAEALFTLTPTPSSTSSTRDENASNADALSQLIANFATVVSSAVSAAQASATVPVKKAFIPEELRRPLNATEHREHPNVCGIAAYGMCTAMKKNHLDDAVSTPDVQKRDENAPNTDAPSQLVANVATAVSSSASASAGPASATGSAQESIVGNSSNSTTGSDGASEIPQGKIYDPDHEPWFDHFFSNALPNNLQKRDEDTPTFDQLAQLAADVAAVISSSSSASASQASATGPVKRAVVMETPGDLRGSTWEYNRNKTTQSPDGVAEHPQFQHGCIRTPGSYAVCMASRENPSNGVIGPLEKRDMNIPSADELAQLAADIAAVISSSASATQASATGPVKRAVVMETPGDLRGGSWGYNDKNENTPSPGVAEHPHSGSCSPASEGYERCLAWKKNHSKDTVSVSGPLKKRDEGAPTFDQLAQLAANVAAVISSSASAVQASATGPVKRSNVENVGNSTSAQNDVEETPQRK